MINDLKDNSNKELNDVEFNQDEKISKDLEILGKKSKQMEMVDMKY
jgi:hypothetical protein